MKRAKHGLMALCLLIASGLSAQNPEPAKTAAATTPAPVAAATPPAAKPVSVDEAYRKEFAFLSAQKRELAAQLQQMQRHSTQQQAALNSEIAALESRVLALDNETSRLADESNLAEEAAINNEETSNLLAATFAQASATLEGFGIELMKSEPFAALADGDKTAQMFAAADQKLGELSTVRKQPTQRRSTGCTVHIRMQGDSISFRFQVSSLMCRASDARSGRAPLAGYTLPPRGR